MWVSDMEVRLKALRKGDVLGVWNLHMGRRSRPQQRGSKRSRTGSERGVMSCASDLTIPLFQVVRSVA